MSFKRLGMLSKALTNDLTSCLFHVHTVPVDRVCPCLRVSPFFCTKEPEKKVMSSFSSLRVGGAGGDVWVCNYCRPHSEVTSPTTRERKSARTHAAKHPLILAELLPRDILVILFTSGLCFSVDLTQ